MCTLSGLVGLAMAMAILQRMKFSGRFNPWLQNFYTNVIYSFIIYFGIIPQLFVWFDFWYAVLGFFGIRLLMYLIAALLTSKTTTG
jgi:hypothetical protein